MTAAEDNKLWCVAVGKRIVSVFSTEAKANVLCRFLNDEREKAGGLFIVGKNKDGFVVKNLFIDCYTNKIEKGYRVWVCDMKKDGTVINIKETFASPTLYGFKQSFITMQHEKNTDYWIPTLSYQNMVANKECIIAETNSYRLKSLLDDIWTETQRQCNERNAQESLFRAQWVKEKTLTNTQNPLGL